MPETTPPNVYLSPKAIRFIDIAIESYCDALGHTMWHLDEDGKAVLDNDLSYYHAIQRSLVGLKEQP